MRDTPKLSVVEEWLAEEQALDPQCGVVAAVRASTNDDELDEATLLKKLRGLATPPTAK